MLLLTDLGARLKEARLAKGLSLEDLQEVTKIQKRYLVGIEEGNYSIMPGSFYVRAFIKQYAEAVGLDPEEVLSSYQQDIPGVKQEEVAQAYTQNTRRRRITPRSSNKILEMMPMIIAALFIVVIIVFSWYLYQQKAANKVPSEEGEVGSEVLIDKNKDVTDNKGQEEPEDEGKAEESQPEEEEEPVEEIKQVVTQTTVNGLDVLFDVTNTTELKIRVEIAQQSSWVAFRNTQGIDNLGKEYFQGETVEYDATADGYVRIRLGRQTAVKVFVNDEEITSPSNEYTQNYIIQLAQQ
ncbi:helix-turn-helix domain-containing protein [Metasolibacillus meyeri]|uniref:helix-turn-helix domain-containing protein n=1 Tax=Metasolibacillus meyeri TaxID=1071052 RepID=UPI00187D4E6E|nr:helix-turn-helix domain-containing protein [Metasolibacillus meyeri]